MSRLQINLRKQIYPSVNILFTRCKDIIRFYNDTVKTENVNMKTDDCETVICHILDRSDLGDGTPRSSERKASEYYRNMSGCIGEDENGKPISEKTYFNISHSGKYTVFVTSDKPIGVDIEMIDEKLSQNLDKALNEKEIRYMKLSDNRLTYLFRMWTCKEAYLKMIGLGLRIDPSRIIVDFDCNEVYDSENESARYSVISLDYQNYIISVCSPKTIGCIELTHDTLNK